MQPTSFLIVFILSAVGISQIAAENRTFTVDYENETFLKDGQPFRYISGTLHYFQIPRELWRDRMLRMRALGCNALQTYVIWSLHQPSEKAYDFTKDANLTEYLSLAKELGFVVILRLGPYIDAEMDFGGFPYWLLKNKDIVLRSSKDDRYLKAVQDWFQYLLITIVKPMLYQNGGPIILTQIENEYGFYPACDQKYMLWMRDLVRQFLGNDPVLITTDGASVDALKCAQVPPGVLPTIDFGVGTEQDVKQR